MSSATPPLSPRRLPCCHYTLEKMTLRPAGQPFRSKLTKISTRPSFTKACPLPNSTTKPPPIVLRLIAGDPPLCVEICSMAQPYDHFRTLTDRFHTRDGSSSERNRMSGQAEEDLRGSAGGMVAEVRRKMGLDGLTVKPTRLCQRQPHSPCGPSWLCSTAALR